MVSTMVSKWCICFGFRSHEHCILAPPGSRPSPLPGRNGNARVAEAVFELKLGGGALCTMEGQTQRPGGGGRRSFLRRREGKGRGREGRRDPFWGVFFGGKSFLFAGHIMAETIVGELWKVVFVRGKPATDQDPCEIGRDSG